MRRPLPNFIGGFYRDPDLHWSAQDCLNYLPVRAERPGAKSAWILRQAPGLRPLVNVHVVDPQTDQPPLSGATRVLWNVEGRLFSVAGSGLYEVTPSLGCILRGVIPGVGRGSAAHNQKGTGNELLVVNGYAGYVYDTTTQTFQKITDTGYPGAFIADFVDGYLPQVEPQGRYWFHSDLANALEYNTLDQYEAEADPDRIVTLIVSHREVLVFGKDTIEPFVNVGASEGTFQRASNTVIECGCSAKYTPARMDNSVFWVDDKRIVRRLDGYTPVRISTVAIEAALAECTAQEIASAFAFTWEDRGHKVYYLTVPGRFTFGFDLLTGEWHRRSSPGRLDWRITHLVFWNGQWVGGDREGNLYALDWDYFFDGQEELVRERVGGAITDTMPLTLNELELLVSVGGPVSEPVHLAQWIPLAESGFDYTFNAFCSEAYCPNSTLVGSTVSGSDSSHPSLPLAQIVFTDLTDAVDVRVTFNSYTGDENGAASPTPAAMMIGGVLTENTVEPVAGAYASFEPSSIDGEVGAVEGEDGISFYGIGFTPLEGVPFNTFSFDIDVFAVPDVEPRAYDRKVQIAVSKDGGHTWSDWRERPLGELGQYRKRVVFTRFGQARDFRPRVRCTSPVRCDLIEAIADVEPGDE